MAGLRASNHGITRRIDRVQQRTTGLNFRPQYTFSSKKLQP